MKRVLLSFLGLLLLSSSYLIGWNKGFDLGYEGGIADVLIGAVNPNTYFMKYIHVPSHRSN